VIDYFFNTASPVVPEDGQTLYMVTVNVNGSGSVAKSPDQATFSPGDVVELTAVADAGWQFDGWSGDLSGFENPVTVTITENLVIEANFTEVPTVQYDLTVNMSGSGSVTLNPPGGTYNEGTVVELTATADTGWEFTGWSGDASGSVNPLTMVVDADKYVTAVFVADSAPPVISNIEVSVGQNSVVITWSTDEPATSVVSYGETSAYELGTEQDTSLVVNHLVVLSGLAEDTLYHFQIASEDVFGNEATSMDMTFNTISDPSGIVSDDFNVATLDTGLWTLVDPMGDVVLTMSGMQAEISVPSGISHDVWLDGNFAPRIMQVAEDTDFEIEVKFESEVSEKYQLQGLLVEEDTDNFLRFDFYSDGSSTWIFAASFSAGSPSVKRNTSIGAVGEPLYMRVSRQGDQWTQSYSGDGVNWSTGAVFSHSLVVSSVGVFAGNAGTNAPAHTAVIDYFFNTASPVVPEDGQTLYMVTVNVNGSGSVNKMPDQSTFSPGDVVELTAVADAGWQFDGWGGDVVSFENPLLIEVDSDLVLDASFINISGSFNLTVNTIGSGSVTLNPPGGSYYEGTVVELTAEPDSGSNFKGWSGDLSGTENPAIIMIQSDTIITANFGNTSTIDIWYGPEQEFGDIGIPQHWVNILGNVADQDGIASLTYSLNGGPETALSIGPNDSRLVNEGDFNIDIAYDDLLSGENHVFITAVDNFDNQTIENVTIDCSKGNIWPKTYFIDWSDTQNIQDVAQIVDGKWRIESNAVRTIEPGYDRLIAIGDVTWDDYEITVPVKVHSFTDGLWGHGIGLLLRWEGHYIWDDVHPSWGWYPMGAIGWFRDYDCECLRIEDGGNGLKEDDNSGFNLVTNTWYVFKMRVVTATSGGATYSLKVWEQGTTEPEDWQVVAEETVVDFENGSLLLLAHNTDASFGNVTITPIE